MSHKWNMTDITIWRWEVRSEKWEVGSG